MPEMRFFAWIALLPSVAAAALVPDVRAAIGRGDFAAGESLIEQVRQRTGTTPETILALSWLGRGALAAKRLNEAESYASRTRQQALQELNKRHIDAEPSLPLALGASIEVQAHVLDAQGRRSEALSFLTRELNAYRGTSIHTRIQKNINLLGMEGKPAPPLDTTHWIGRKAVPLAQLKGRPVLLFFWAHWCPDCKAQAPILARLAREFGPKGFALVGPSQHYGYVAGGEDASRPEETKYIDQVRRQYYAELDAMPVPLGEDAFRTYGVSTTPTLVLVDSKGIVRMYHPGRMTYEQLRDRIVPLLR